MGNLFKQIPYTFVNTGNLRWDIDQERDGVEAQCSRSKHDGCALGRQTAQELNAIEYLPDGVSNLRFCFGTRVFGNFVRRLIFSVKFRKYIFQTFLPVRPQTPSGQLAEFELGVLPHCP